MKLKLLVSLIFFDAIEDAFVQKRILMWHPISTAYASHPWPAGLSRRARTCDTVPIRFAPSKLNAHCSCHQLHMVRMPLQPDVDDICKDMYIYTVNVYILYITVYIYISIYILYTVIYIYIYIYGKCLGFARTRNDDRRRIIIIIIRIKPLLKIFNECRSLTGVGELNPY